MLLISYFSDLNTEERKSWYQALDKYSGVNVLLNLKQFPALEKMQWFEVHFFDAEKNIFISQHNCSLWFATSMKIWHSFKILL